MKILEICLDDKITEVILEKCKFFSLTHPNAITFFGIVLNFLLLSQCKDPGIMFLFMLTLRYFADCLDGGVARKYQKVSKFGGLLDTVSDTLLLAFMTFCICEKYDLDNAYLISFGVALSNLLFIICQGSATDHSNIKFGVAFGKRFYAFLVNNSFIMFTACGLIIFF